jgi:hypothetical protein
VNKAVENESKDQNLLSYIPEKKHKDFKTKDDKVQLIFTHNKPIERLIQWLLKKPSTSDIELDSMGSRAWLCMNGQNTIYDIGRILEKEFGNQCQPVYKRLALFIKYLSGQGWIAIRREESKRE